MRSARRLSTCCSRSPNTRQKTSINHQGAEQQPSCRVIVAGVMAARWRGVGGGGRQDRPGPLNIHRKTPRSFTLAGAATHQPSTFTVLGTRTHCCPACCLLPPCTASTGEAIGARVNVAPARSTGKEEVKEDGQETNGRDEGKHRAAPLSSPGRPE
ncbi:hypothetical protein E2C01_010888 [Portunus trituberculatus]|uniref:Uncharacterized protein n=1 Tax=Portunus trituberculatus TaxID=210409 RepID=A0A5B7DA30_PORTR|nr:hypothetical protein [Portunus trituberculatus]